MSLNLEGSLDTNIVLRYILGDVESQTKIVDKLIGSGINLRVSDLVIAEIVYILEAKGFRRSEVVETLEPLLAQNNLYITRSVVSPALEMYEKHSSVSFVDAMLVFDTSQSYATPLYTFDKKLANKSTNCKIPT